jgi:hypothetical protein
LTVVAPKDIILDDDDPQRAAPMPERHPDEAAKFSKE